MKRKNRAEAILERLIAEYPDPHCALRHRSAFQLLMATILSAQCTDERVNMVTAALFRKFPTPKSMGAADTETVEDLIRSTGFYRNKTKSLIGAGARIAEVYGGKVPDTMEDLLTIPGVARKTANVVLGTWFGKNEGIVVDTHVGRLSRRMGLTRQTNPVKIETDLVKIIPQPEFTNFSHRLIEHGRKVCDARVPRCESCVIGAALCPAFDPEQDHWRGGSKRSKKHPVRKKTSAARKPTPGKKTARKTPAASRKRTISG